MLEQFLYASLCNLHLLQKRDTATVVADLLGLQAQFANNPKYALRIRAADYHEDSWHKSLLTTWTFRGTLHAVLKEELGLFLAAVGLPDTWDDRWDLDPKLKAHWAEKLWEWIASGITERSALKEKCLAAGLDQDTLNRVFHGWGGLLRDMCSRGMIAYAPGTAKHFVPCFDVPFPDRHSARVEIIRRYFRSFGPATFGDCAYFTGWRVREVTALVEAAALPLKSISYQGKEYYYLQELPARGAIPDCLLLAGFDQLVMGYRDRSRFLDEEDKSKVITNTGIVFPTILLGGRLKARWKKERSKLLVTPFRSLSRREQELITEKARAVFPGEVQEVLFLG
ncbi:MAG TPA: winged helix DNA-binding domain-containing protein [Limnochordia bacterium]|nr:winged helix DNA-binding domain-containing protein [Limnochordia bacterium]